MEQVKICGEKGKKNNTWKQSSENRKLGGRRAQSIVRFNILLYLRDCQADLL